jgi:hypothetical protein
LSHMVHDSSGLTAGNANTTRRCRRARRDAIMGERSSR